MVIDDIMQNEIDHGFFRVTLKQAYDLIAENGNTSLPCHGYEQRVKVNGATCWLARTQVNGKTVWAIHGGQFEQAIRNKIFQEMFSKR